MTKKKKKKASKKSIDTIKKVNEYAKKIYKEKKGKRGSKKYNYLDALKEAGKKVKGNKLF